MIDESILQPNYYWSSLVRSQSWLWGYAGDIYDYPSDVNPQPYTHLSDPSSSITRRLNESFPEDWKFDLSHLKDLIRPRIIGDSVICDNSLCYALLNVKEWLVEINIETSGQTRSINKVMHSNSYYGRSVFNYADGHVQNINSEGTKWGRSPRSNQAITEEEKAEYAQDPKGYRKYRLPGGFGMAHGEYHEYDGPKPSELGEDVEDDEDIPYIAIKDLNIRVSLTDPRLIMDNSGTFDVPIMMPQVIIGVTSSRNVVSGPLTQEFYDWIEDNHEAEAGYYALLMKDSTPQDTVKFMGLPLRSANKKKDQGEDIEVADTYVQAPASLPNPSNIEVSIKPRKYWEAGGDQSEFRIRNGAK